MVDLKVLCNFYNNAGGIICKYVENQKSDLG